MKHWTQNLHVIVIALVAFMAGSLVPRAANPSALDEALVPVVDTVILSASDFRDHVVSIEAVRAGVPVAMALAVSHAENWSGRLDARSVAGAVGIMQVMPYERNGTTPLWINAWPTTCYGDRPLDDAWRNACVGSRILRRYFTESNQDWDLTLRKYNGAEFHQVSGDRYIAAVRNRLTDHSILMQ